METKTLQKILKQALLLVILSTNLTILKAQVGNVIWEENFNTLNTDIWTPNVGDGCAIGLCGWGNAELEYYNTDNVYIADIPGESGNKALVLEARNQTIGSSSFTSGKVDTEGKLSIQYGLIEIRMRVPNLETGLWPAAWLLGTANLTWPAKGEIDIMEMGHSQTERTRQGHPSSSVNNYVGANAIWQNSADGGVASIAWDVDYDQPYVSSTPLNDRFVTYRLYWEPTQMRYTVVDNGIEYDLYTNPFPLDADGDTKTFQRPFYMLLNLAVGGNFTDAANANQVTATLPAKMYIDYVRVSEWNGYGNVELDDGQLTAESGVFGIYTDNTPTNNKLDFGNDAAIYVWGGTMQEGSTPAYEGTNVIAWETTTPNSWFGGGIVSLFGKNMSNFVDEGKLKFKIKIPADVSFKIGMTDNYTNEKYVDFPAGQTKYGLVRNGDWGQVEIPIADFSGLIAFQDINYLFAIVSDAANLPSSTFQLAIDDIVWDDGNGTTIIPVTGVTVSPTSKTLKINENQQLTATVLPSNASNQNITWSTSNASIASVNSSGLVTAQSAGNATITATTEDGNFKATCSVIVEADNTLPSPWETSNIGSVGAEGSATYNNGTFTLEGSGADIWGTSDEFRYVYQPIDGDVVITAKVNSLTNTDAWAKAGVMIRENLNGNSKHAMSVVTAGNGTAFQRRETTGGSSAHNAGSSSSAPYWVKLERSGDTFTGSVSSDGTNWTTINSSSFTMSATAYVGLVTTSHNDGSICTAQISDVTINTSNITYAAIPGTIQAEDYTDMFGIQTEATTDVGGGLNVGWIDEGDWLDFAVDVSTTGNYLVKLRGATPNGPDVCDILIDNNTVGNINIDNTQGWQEWETFETTVSLTEGLHTLRLSAATTGFNINWIEFTLNNQSSDCSVVGATGDYTAEISNDASNPTITFVPSRTEVGSSVCILYYGTSATGGLPGYNVTPNVPYEINAQNGEHIYFYYTYSLPEGGENNTAGARNDFTVGNCSSLKSTSAGTTKIEKLDNEPLSSQKLILYPNPAKTDLNISGIENVDKLIICTLSGSELLVKKVKETNKTLVNIGHLIKGIYLLKAVYKNSVKTIPFVKE